MVKVTSGGKGNEPWYKSRRMWGLVLGAAALVIGTIYPDSQTLISHIVTYTCQVAGIALPAISWIKPK